MKRACGLDVHKDSIFCATYNGQKHGPVKEFTTLTSSIRKMGEDLKSEGIDVIAMESTGMYWIPVWNILEEMGFDLILVNPFLIKQMPGRKSDVKDAQWIATLLYKGLLRSSLVPYLLQSTTDSYWSRRWKNMKCSSIKAVNVCQKWNICVMNIIRKR